MNFDSQKILPYSKNLGRDSKLKISILICPGNILGGGGHRTESETVDHIVTHHLDIIQINDCPIIPPQVQDQANRSIQGGHFKLMPEVIGHMTALFWSLTDFGRFSSISKTKLSRTALPGAVVVGGLSPVRNGSKNQPEG